MSNRTALTPKGIANLALPETGQKDYADPLLPGFAVRVTAKGAKSFVVYYRVDGKLVRDTIGRFDPTAKGEPPRGTSPGERGNYPEPGSLAWARAIARQRKEAAAAGKDPRQDVRRQKEGHAKRRATTYAATVEEFIQKYAIGKKANRTAKEQKRLLLKHGWGDTPLADITVTDIHDRLDALMADGKPYLANRVYAALNTFFRWAHKRAMVAPNPMDRVDRPFDGEAKRERYYTDDEIKRLWKAADKLSDFEGAFLRLCLLTGKRKGEVAGMTWDEVDLDGGRYAEAHEFTGPTWTLPAERSKNRREHILPLPPLAVRILKQVPRVEGQPHVFPGRVRGTHLSPGSTLQAKIAAKAKVPDFTFHALRHTLSTALDRLKVPPHVAERVTHHTPPGSAREHYRHYQYLPEQKDALEAWAEHVQRAVYGDKVEALA